MAVLSGSSASSYGGITVVSDVAGEPLSAAVRATPYEAGDEQDIANGTGALWSETKTSIAGINTFQNTAVGDNYYGIVQLSPNADYSHSFTVGDSAGLITLGGFAADHRASEATAIDVDGVLRALPENAPILPGARIVYNSIDELYNWRDDGATIVKSGEDRVIAFDSTGKSIYAIAKAPYSDETIADGVYALSVDLKGSGTVTLSCGRNVDGTDTPATASITLTSSYVRYGVVFTGLAGNLGVKAAIIAGTATGCTAKNVQHEVITGAASQVPADFVPNLTAKWYSKTNGNTLSSNIVASVLGTDISGISGILTEPTSYDLLPYPNVVTPDWLANGAYFTSPDGNGINGAKTSISWDAIVGYNVMRYNSLPHFASTDISLSAWVKKRGAAASFKMAIENTVGGTNNVALFDFDAQTAIVETGSGTATIIEPPRADGYMRVSFTAQGGSGTGTGRVDIGSNGGILVDIFVDSVQLEQAPTASSNLLPRGSGMLRAETNMVAAFADIGLAPQVNDIQLTTQLIMGHTEGELCGLGDRTNGIFVDIDGTTLTCTKYVSGTPYVASGTVPAYVAGDSVTLVAAASSSGVSCTWNGANQITNANTTDFAAAVSTVTVGNSYNTCKSIGVAAI